MINLFKKFFRSTTTKEDQNIEKNERINAITIVLADNNEPYIHISITDTDNDKAIFFARMLSNLQNGEYSNSIINILNELGNKDHTINLFVNQIMTSWKLYEQFNQEQEIILNKDPLVRPSDFFKGFKHE